MIQRIMPEWNPKTNMSQICIGSNSSDTDTFSTTVNMKNFCEPINLFLFFLSLHAKRKWISLVDSMLKKDCHWQHKQSLRTGIQVSVVGKHRFPNNDMSSVNNNKSLVFC